MAEWTFSTGDERFLPQVFDDFGIGKIFKALEHNGMKYHTKIFDFEKNLGILVSIEAKRTAFIVSYDSVGQGYALRHGLKSVMIPLSDDDLSKLMQDIKGRLNAND